MSKDFRICPLMIKTTYLYVLLDLFFVRTQLNQIHSFIKMTVGHRKCTHKDAKDNCSVLVHDG